MRLFQIFSKASLIDRMEYPIPDASFISLVKTNCKPELSNLLYALQIYSKEALSRAGKDAEQQLLYQNKLYKPHLPRYDNRREVSELNLEEKDPWSKIKELEATISALKVSYSKRMKSVKSILSHLCQKS